MTKADETFSTTSEKNDSKGDTLSFPLSPSVESCSRHSIVEANTLKKNKGTMINVRLYLPIFLSL